MIRLRTQLLVAPLLLTGVVATSLLRQPSDRASAYSDGGSAIYSALVVTPTTPHRAILARPTHVAHVLLVPALRARAPLAPRTSSFDLRGAPTISVKQINQVLAAYGSPLSGQGRALYDLGVKYGIDPAFCLAFFVHESAAGTRGEAVATHSLGNIRSIPGAPSQDGYRYYATWLEGAEDWYRLISSLYIHGWKLTTVDQIIPVYAPSGDNNDPTAYIDDVEQLVSAWRAQG